MQNSPVVQQKTELEGSSTSLEQVLYTIPQELLGVIPESVWVGLSIDQKKEILRQNSLLEKYVSVEKPSDTISVASNKAEDISMSTVKEDKQEGFKNPEFVGAVEEVRKIEQEQEFNFPVEDTNRVEQERLTTQSSAKSSWGAKVFGYPVSDDLVNESSVVSENGEIEDGKTWSATLIQKILAVFGQ